MLGRATLDTGKASLLTLSFCPMLLSALCGIGTTADCISREKREGTLPLLLLTRLSPAEILAQKTISTAAPFVSGLVAVLPLYALPVVLGGVSGRDALAVMILALATAFYSLSIGCFVSCLTWSTAASVGGTFCCLAVFFGASTVLDALRSTVAIGHLLVHFNPIHVYVDFFQNVKT